MMKKQEGDAFILFMVVLLVIMVGSAIWVGKLEREKGQQLFKKCQEAGFAGGTRIGKGGLSDGNYSCLDKHGGVYIVGEDPLVLPSLKD